MPNQLLDNYTAAVHARDAHIEANNAVFSAHEQIVLRIIDAENALRDAVAVSKEPVSNGEFKVTITPQESEVTDIAKIDELVNLGVLSYGTRAQIVKMQKRPDRITITRA